MEDAVKDCTGRGCPPLMDTAHVLRQDFLGRKRDDMLAIAIAL